MSSGGRLDAQFRDAMIGTTASPSLAFVLCGETVTHTARKTPGVTPVATVITAVRIPTSDMLEAEYQEMTKWVVAAADLASDPVEGDTITDDAAVQWGVTRVTPQEGGIFQLTCMHSKEQ